MDYQKQMETMTKKGGQGHSELGENFTVSQAQKSIGQLQAMENAVDIKVFLKIQKIQIFILFTRKFFYF